MRFKLIKQFQMIEQISGIILKYAGTNQDELSKDQLKLQRNIRQYVINYLKNYSFNLVQIPTKEAYLKLKAQRELHLQEEMNRIEHELNMQRKKLNNELNKRQQNGTKNEPNLGLVSIDNSNGWVPSYKVSEILEKDDDTAQTNDDYETDQQKALKIQIQLVENYLEDAIKQNKHEEASILQKNLNELLNMLVDK
jgi:hypothetical protein